MTVRRQRTPIMRRFVTVAPEQRRPVRPAAGRKPVISKAVSSRSVIHEIEAADQFAIDLLKAGKPPFDSFREGKYTHVSDIISKCSRKIALIRRMGVKHTPRQLLDGHAITFAQGNAIHDFVKRRFIEGHPDKVWARWECRCGATMTEPMTYAEITADMACHICGHEPRTYHEVSFADETLEVVGSPDVILYMKQHPAYYPIEVKSMVAGQWDELQRPVPDHVIQALFYWKLMRDRKYPLASQLSILYVKKEYTWKLPYKEFIIYPERELKKLKLFLEDLKVLAEARDPKKPLPPRVTCGTIDAPEAKQCPVCVTCFQLP